MGGSKCEINTAYYAGNEPTRLRFGFGHNLGFSTLGSTLVASIKE